MLTKNQTQRLWEVYLEEKGRAWLEVKSGSMSPLIPVGARVLVKRCHFKDIRLFDLVVFRSNEQLIVHRVIKKSKGHLLQAGDKFASPSIIPEGCILGRAEVIEVPDSVIDLRKKKTFFLNIIVSVIYIMARKIPNHNYWLLKINHKLIGLAKETF